MPQSLSIPHAGCICKASYNIALPSVKSSLEMRNWFLNSQTTHMDTLSPTEHIKQNILIAQYAVDRLPLYGLPWACSILLWLFSKVVLWGRVLPFPMLSLRDLAFIWWLAAARAPTNRCRAKLSYLSRTRTLWHMRARSCKSPTTNTVSVAQSHGC